MLKPILVLMTRWPAPKRCKTRLAKDIGFYNAAHIQRCLTNHTIAVAKDMESQGLVEIKLAIEGIGNKKIRSWSRSYGINLACSQGGGSLGLKMKRQMIKAQRGSAKSNQPRDTILIGSDVPNLCKLDIISALNALNKNELVIGPAQDGGYWLIGFSKRIITQSISWPFTGIKWGSNSVLEETLARAKTKGIKYKLANNKNDLDLITDLNLWQV